MKRKTHDEYVAELAVKNPGVTVVGEYVNALTKIEHLCGGCGESWEVTPNQLLTRSSDYGCKRCVGKKITKAQSWTHEKYVAELARVSPGVAVIGHYVNARKKIEHQCICGKKWSVIPYSALKGTLCGDCGNKKIRAHKQKSKQEYIADLAARHKNITVIGRYENAHTPIKHMCDKGHVWEATPSNIFNGGTGCPHCGQQGTDANVFYIWENANDRGVYKVGITSERCAEKRIAKCAARNGTTANVILMVSTPHARDIERRALELGDDPLYFDAIDGYTEFRRYSDAELGEVWRMAVGA